MLADLAYITVAIAIFEASDDIEEIPPYVDIHRCIMLGEAMVLCKEALAAHGPLNTRQLALRVMGSSRARRRTRSQAQSAAEDAR